LKCATAALSIALAGCAATNSGAGDVAADTGPAADAPAARLVLGSARFLQVDPIESLAWSVDGTAIAAGDLSGCVVSWDAGSGAPVRRFEGLDGAASAVAPSPDGARVAAMTQNQHAAVWDTADGNLMFRAGTTDAGGAQRCSAAWTRDGSHLALGAVRTLVVDGRDGGPVAQWDHGVVWSLAFSPDGALLAEGGYGARVLDSATGKTVSELNDPTPRMSFNALTGAVHVSDRAVVVEAVLGSGVALRRDGASGPVRRLEVADGDIGACAISPDGDRLALVGPDGTVRLWTWTGGREIARFRPSRGGVLAVAFSPDGLRVATGGGEGRVRIWDAATGAEIAPPPGHAGAVLAVAASSDGARVATAGSDGTVRLWDARTGREERVLLHEAGPVHAVAFSADGRLVAAGGWERKITVVEAATGTVRTVSPEQAEDVRAVAFAAEGNAEAVAPASRTCPQGHTDRVTAALPCDGGRSLVSASWDGTVRLWDLATGAEKGRIEDPGIEFTALAVGPGDRFVWAGRSDGTVIGYPWAELSGPR
jgi:WD40 repeat protein